MPVITVEILKGLAAFCPNAYANEFQQSSINQHPLKSVSIWWFSSCQNGCNLHAKGVTWVECQNIWLCEWWPGMIIAFNGLDISDEVYYTIRLMTE